MPAPLPRPNHLATALALLSALDAAGKARQAAEALLDIAADEMTDDSIAKYLSPTLAARVRAVREAGRA